MSQTSFVWLIDSLTGTHRAPVRLTHPVWQIGRFPCRSGPEDILSGSRRRAGTGGKDVDRAPRPGQVTP